MSAFWPNFRAQGKREELPLSFRQTESTIEIVLEALIKDAQQAINSRHVERLEASNSIDPLVRKTSLLIHKHTLDLSV